MYTSSNGLKECCCDDRGTFGSVCDRFLEGRTLSKQGSAGQATSAKHNFELQCSSYLMQAGIKAEYFASFRAEHDVLVFSHHFARVSAIDVPW